MIPPAQIKETTSKGFSLIEVLVSLAIFTIVVTISVGSLLMLIAANARARNIQEVMTNLTFTLDSMTRDIRTGTDYNCQTDEEALPIDGNTTNDCVTAGDAFAFNEGGVSLTASTANDSRRIGFALSSSEGAIIRRLGNGSWFSITSPSTVITDLRFVAVGTTRGGTDILTPVVTIFVEGYAKDDEKDETGNYPSQFYIQTSVTQQILDI